MRSKKILSIVLAMSMMFGMNSFAYADDIIEVVGEDEVTGSSLEETGAAVKATGWYTQYDSVKKQYSEPAELDSDGYFNVDVPTSGSATTYDDIVLFATEGAEDLKIRQVTNDSKTYSRVLIYVDSKLKSPVKIYRENDKGHDLRIKFAAFDNTSDIAVVQDRSNIGKTGLLDNHQYVFGRINKKTDEFVTFSGLNAGGDFTYTLGEVDYIEVNDYGEIEGLKKDAEMPVLAGVTFSSLNNLTDYEEKNEESKTVKYQAYKAGDDKSMSQMMSYFHNVDDEKLINYVGEDGIYSITDFNRIWENNDGDTAVDESADGYKYVVAETESGVGILKVNKPLQIRAALNSQDIGTHVQGSIIGVTFSSINSGDYSFEDREASADTKFAKYVLWNKYTGQRMTNDDFVDLKTEVSDENFSYGSRYGYSTAYNDDLGAEDNKNYVNYFEVSENGAWAAGLFTFVQSSDNSDKVNNFSEMTKKVGYFADGTTSNSYSNFNSLDSTSYDSDEGYFVTKNLNQKKLYISENKVKSAVGLEPDQDLTVKRYGKISGIKDAVGKATYRQNENYFNEKYNYLKDVYRLPVRDIIITEKLNDENGELVALNGIQFNYMYDGKNKSETEATNEVGDVEIVVAETYDTVGAYESASITVTVTEDGQNVYVVEVPEIKISSNTAGSEVKDIILKTASVRSEGGNVTVSAGSVSADYLTIKTADGEDLPESITKSLNANVSYSDGTISANGVAVITVIDEEPEVVTYDVDVKDLTVSKNTLSADFIDMVIENTTVSLEGKTVETDKDGFTVYVDSDEATTLDEALAVSGNFTVGVIYSDEVAVGTGSANVTVTAKPAEEPETVVYTVKVNDLTVSQGMVSADFVDYVIENTVVSLKGEAIKTEKDGFSVYAVSDDFENEFTLDEALSTSGNFTVGVIYKDDIAMGVGSANVTVKASEVEPVPEEIKVTVPDLEATTDMTANDFEAMVALKMDVEGVDVVDTNDIKINVLTASVNSVTEMLSKAGDYEIEVVFTKDGKSGSDTADVKVTEAIVEPEIKAELNVKDFTVSQNISEDDFMMVVSDNTTLTISDNDVSVTADILGVKPVGVSENLATLLTQSGNFVINVEYSVGAVSVSDNATVTVEPVKSEDKNTTPSANAVVPNTVSIDGVAKIGDMTILYPTKLPFVGANYKKYLKGTSIVSISGDSATIKSISIKMKASKTGTAEIKSIKFSNGKKVKKPGINIQITPFVVTNDNVKNVITLGKVKVNKKNQVKGLKANFSDIKVGNNTLSSLKAKKVSPKIASYNATTKTVTFADPYNGTISGNLIGLN